MRVAISCPAKINTFLSVGKPDASGYHPLRTIFQSVGLWDDLVLTDDVERDEIYCRGMELPEENTLTKTLRLIREPAALPPLRVELTKRIPAQSGLGGGSSDAAGLIRATDLFLPAPLSEHLKHDIATAIGADVPFFLVGGLARGEGYGEILSALPDPEPRWLVLSRPAAGCSTPQMFGALDAKEYAWREFPSGYELYNDFERVAPCECIELIERLQVFGADDAGLSGSGSAVFASYGSQASAKSAARRVEEELGYWTAVCHTLTRAEALEPPRIIG